MNEHEAGMLDALMDGEILNPEQTFHLIGGTKVVVLKYSWKEVFKLIWKLLRTRRQEIGYNLGVGDLLPEHQKAILFMERGRKAIQVILNEDIYQRKLKFKAHYSIFGKLAAKGLAYYGEAERIVAKYQMAKKQGDTRPSKEG